MTDGARVSANAEPAPAAPVRVLLRGVVDYAGLFPPASLAMKDATAAYAEHRASREAWALGRFVLPAARLDEFEESSATLFPRQAAQSWALSALLGSDLEEDIGRVERFNARHSDARAGAVLVDTVELKTHTARDVARAGELLDRRFDTYMEVPVADDPADLIAAIARTMAKAKIRTGGVTPEAFPASAQVVRFIASCIRDDVRFKATAGLHHPLRAEYRLTYAPDAPKGAMFGFLNVLLAVAALGSGWTPADAIAVLEERDATALQFDRDEVRWRGRPLGMSALELARDRMAAFGSCSFHEPISDLKAMHLL